MADQELKLKVTAQKQGDAIKTLKDELTRLVDALTQIKQNNLQLRKDFGSSSQEYIDGKKKEIQITSDLAQKKKSLSELEKDYSRSLKELASERSRLLKEEAEKVKAKIQEEKRLQKEQAEEEKRLQKEQIENLKIKEQAEKELQKQRSDKIKGLGEPVLLKQLQYEYKLLGAEQVKLIQNNQRSSETFQTNKNRLQELKKEIQGLKREMSGLGAESKLSGLQLLEAMENVTTVLFGIRQFVSDTTRVIGSTINAGLDFKILRQSFKGTAEDLELLRKATAGTVSDANLINLSNQASLLNISLEDQARLLGFVESRYDEFRGDLTGGFEKLLKAVQGSSKGLKALKLDTVAYENTLAKLVKEKGGELEIEEQLNNEKEFTIKNLSFEEANTLRVKSALEIMNFSLQDAIDKKQDSKDKFESYQVAVENAKASIGVFVVDGLGKAISSLGIFNRETVKTAGVISVLGGQLLSLLPALATLNSGFPQLGSTIAKTFGAGGPVVIAIGLTIFWISELVSKIRTAQREAEQLQRYNERVQQQTFIQSYNPNAPSDQTINKYKDILKKDPEQDITVNNRTLKLKDYITELEKANQESKQFGKTWNEMSGQTVTNIKELEKSSKELGTQIDNLNTKLSELKPSDPSLKKYKEQRDALLKQKAEVDKQIAPPETSSKSGSTTKKEPVQTYKEENKAIDDLISSLQIELNLLDLKRSTYKSIDEILQELIKNENLLSQPGVTKQNIAQFYSFEKSLTDRAEEERRKRNKQLTDKELESVKQNLQTEYNLIEDTQNLIDKAKVSYIENEFKRKSKLVELEYEQEIREIKRKGFIERQELELLKQSEIKLEKEKEKIRQERSEKIKNAQVTLLNESLGLAEKINNIINKSPDNFLSKFLNGLRQGLDIVNTIRTILETINLIGSLNKGSGGSGFFDTLFNVIKTIVSGGKTGGLIGSGSQYGNSNSTRFINNYVSNNFKSQSQPIVINLLANVDAIKFLTDNMPKYQKRFNKTVITI